MCSTHAGAASGNIAKAARQVLPQDTVPRHYRVFLDPNLTKYTYTGHVEIDVDVAHTTNKVSVNVLDLVTRNATLNGKPATKTTHDEDAQSVTWEFAEAVEQSSKATLRVEFDGTLNDKLCGFYRSVHKDDDGKEQVVATTQMEATDCRRAFPCFDEPALKATFDISIAADKGLTVLSNSDVKSTESLGAKQVTHFNTTPKMSTYLVAFIVGDLRYVESKLFRVPVRVYATPGLEDRCQFSADLAARTLAFFEKTFGIEYPMPKCDMVGIHDFSAGAMENWGLVTYRLVDIFYQEGKDSASTKMRVAEVVQHELAHQWFGNLVTMEWWDGLWLNEGFATWMSWYSCNHFFPEWKVWETYVVDAYQGCLRLDGLRSSHPVQVGVKRADEVAQIFDAISYLKGSCVIRMVSQFLGEDVFIKGISKYLGRHSYGNTVTDDLWNALSDVSGKDVKSFMNSWTRDVGYPILSIGEHGSKDSEVEITQHRYLDTGDVKPEEDETIYPVWLGIRKGDGSVDHSTVLKERSAKISVGSGPFYKLNADQSGIFRVRYPDSDLALLAAEGAKGGSSKLSVEDRIGLLTDLRALSGNYTRTSQLLTVISEWKNDTEPNVVSAILQCLGSIAAMLRFEDEAVTKQYRLFRESVVVPLAKRLGTTFEANEDVRLTMLRSSLFGASISVENKEFVTHALDAFKAKGFDVEPNLRESIYRAVAEYGTEEQWHALEQHYLDGTNGSSGNNALLSLGFTKDINRKKEILAKCLDGTYRSQDVFYAIPGVSRSDKEGAEIAWAWCKENWDKIREAFPVSGSMLGNIVKSVTSGFTKQAQLDDVEAFFADKDVKGVNMALEQSKDVIRTAITFVDKDLDDIKHWLESQTPNL